MKKMCDGGKLNMSRTKKQTKKKQNKTNKQKGNTNTKTTR